MLKTLIQTQECLADKKRSAPTFWLGLHGAEMTPFFCSNFGILPHKGQESAPKQADFKLMSARPYPIITSPPENNLMFEVNIGLIFF